MQLCDRLFGMTAVFLALISTSASLALGGKQSGTTREEREREATPSTDPTTSTTRPAGIPALASPLLVADKVLGSAYYDIVSILSSYNSCSDFFGGSENALNVFQRYMAGLRKDHLAVTVGMRMSGKTINMRSVNSDLVYRLFEKMTVNTNGPFYRQRMSRSDPAVPRLAGFEPNSKAVRALMLLHELGHLIMGPDGKWLLPDDGGNPDLSRENSAKIKAVCGEQIKWL